MNTKQSLFFENKSQDVTTTIQKQHTANNNRLSLHMSYFNTYVGEKSGT